MASRNTMAREREVHAAVTGQPIAAAATASPGSDSDDDLFDDALF